MIFAQFASTAEIHPHAGAVKVLARSVVYEKSASQLWSGPQWVVIENEGKVRITRCNVRTRFEKSNHSGFPDNWYLIPDVPGRVIFYFKGIKPSDRSCTVKILDLPFRNENIAHIKNAQVSLNQNTYTFNYGPPLQNSNYNWFTFSNGDLVQKIGIREPYTSIRILWAGDLNGDGVIDFLISAENDKGTGTTALFLGAKSSTNLVNIAYFSEEQGFD